MSTLLPGHVGTLIVGAGFAGIAMAIRLRAAGDEDWVIIERGPALGGTWRDNDYPGAACDVQSVLYSYSFAPWPSWTRSYSPRQEIQDYLVHVATERGVGDRVVCDTDLLEARWDDDHRVWRVRTSRGELTTAVLVPATGALADPKLPDIDGLADFQGRVFHTSRWPADVSVQGARVAVIGTGASAIQVVPGIVDDVAHLGVFQRSAPWVLRRGDRPIRPGTRRLYARLPAVYAGVRAATRVSRELNTPVFTESSPIGRVIERMARAHMESVVTDPALRAKLTPSYRVGCKRILISDDYYPALTHEHVDVVTDPIERVSATGVLTRDPESGALVEHPVDVMVLATGFLPSRPPVADKVVGVDGRALARLWDARGVHAYKGTAVPGYPNLFFLVGPNTGLGHTSMLLMIEAQVAYVAEAVRLVREGTARRVEVTAAATTAWNDELQRRLAKSIWATGGCSSWYFDEHGRNVTLWPGTTWSFERAVKTFDRDAYLTA